MSAGKYTLLSAAALSACTDLGTVGHEPEFGRLEGSNQHHAIYSTPLPRSTPQVDGFYASSLWNAGSESLLGDKRASRRGDILTVVIEIVDSAKINNSSGRSRSGSQSMGIPQLLGIPQRLNTKLPDGANMSSAVDTQSGSTFSGSGNVSRSEKLTLRVAATVVEELSNGVLRIEGKQEVRVNFEIRELLVSGYIRPTDISRKNEILYDKIAGAQISYGGRGQISEVQQPRYGQQISDILLPF